MERPQVDPTPTERKITGEIMYLDEMRRHGQIPGPFTDLSDMAIQMYEIEADLVPEGVRPDILDELEKYDRLPTPIVASCHALAAELHSLKDPENHFTFVDIALDLPADEILEKVQSIAAGSMLAGDTDQLAIESNGEYYPVLNFTKEKADLVGASLRIWRWEDKKYVFTNKLGEAYDHQKHLIVYPDEEKSIRQQIELSFHYQDEGSGTFSESISLHLGPLDAASMGTQVFASAYAETGYEGHRHTHADEITDDTIAEFVDLIAEIVGDEPESVRQQQSRRLARFIDGLPTKEARRAVLDAVEKLWPAQVIGMLATSPEGVAVTIATMLKDESTVTQGIEELNKLSERY